MDRHGGHRGLAGLALASALSSAAPLHAQEAMTTQQMEALSPRAANRVAQRDLLSLLEPVGKIRRGMFVSLRGIDFQTHPVGTPFKGICRRDTITLWYAPAEDGRPSGDIPVRPQSVQASASFHIIRLPDAGLSERNPPAPIFRDECARLTGGDTSWLRAEDAFHAAQGAILFDRARQAVLAGTLQPLPCPDIFDPQKHTCRQAVGEAGEVGDIGSVDTCPADIGALCYVIDLNSSTKVTIRARGDDTKLLPGDILSIAVEQYVVVT